jgi:hypothetical protein
MVVVVRAYIVKIGYNPNAVPFNLLLAWGQHAGALPQREYLLLA